MSDPSALNLAARVLREVQAGTPADQALRAALVRTRHRSAPAERRAVSRAVFAYFRWWRWLDPKDSLQKQLESARSLQARFEKNPAAFKPETLAARAVPDWLIHEIPWPESVGAVVPNSPASPPPATALEGQRPYPTELAWLQQLQREPVLWIRPKQALTARVAAALGHCSPTALDSQLSTLNSQLSSLRYDGPADLFHSAAFQAGEFEIQDLASQFVSLACAPQPGQTWWDACAGEGGKSLHLSDLMQNKGLLWVSDRSLRRLVKLKERAARAGMFNFRSAPWEGGAVRPTKTRFDGVLVDAPCSGIGTWQRNPHARWTTQPLDVQELAAVQLRLLHHVAPALKSGGRLVYAVCTLSRSETTAVADAFTAAHPEFEPGPVFPAGSPTSPAPVSPNPPYSQPSSLNSQLILWPHELNANGMFLAAWRRK